MQVLSILAVASFALASDWGKVENRSNETIYVKDEYSGTTRAVPPQTDADKIDGFTFAKSKRLYKVPNGCIATVTGPSSVTLKCGGAKANVAKVKAGWKDETWVRGLRCDSSPDTGWDDLYLKAGGKAGSLKCEQPSPTPNPSIDDDSAATPTGYGLMCTRGDDHIRFNEMSTEAEASSLKAAQESGGWSCEIEPSFK